MIAISLDRTDLLWNRLTVGSQQGDGVVPLASQRYPSGALEHVAADPVSHTGQIDTDRSAAAIKRVLQVNVGIQIR